MARDFNGTTNQLTTADIAALRPSLPVSVSAWVKPDVLAAVGIFNNNKTTVQHRGLWFAVSDASGHLEASFGDNTGSSSSDRQSKVSTGVLQTGVWQHVACTITGASNMTLHIGGTDVGGSYSGTGGAMAYAVGVGCTIGMVSGTSFFDGLLAEIAFWDLALSSGEVTSLAAGASPLTIQTADLLAFWPVCGVQSPEPDYKSGFPMAVTGAAAALTSHPFDSVSCRGAGVDQNESGRAGWGALVS